MVVPVVFGASPGFFRPGIRVELLANLLVKKFSVPANYIDDIVGLTT